MALVLVIEPPGDLPERGSDIRQQAEGGGEVERLPRGEGAAIVGQPLLSGIPCGGHNDES